MVKKIWVADMAPGQVVNTCLLVKQKNVTAFREKPGQYLSLLLADRTGVIAGRVWDEAIFRGRQFEAGDVVEIKGTVVEYNGQCQLKIDHLELAEEGYAWEEFLPASRHSPEEMRARLEELVASVDNPHLRDLLQSIFGDKDFYTRFATAPAAKKIHHAYLGGLLEHTLNVASVAEQLAALYPQVDRDLLVTGALLHDIGKAEEFQVRAPLDYTVAGRLLGHIVLGVQMVTLKISNLLSFPADVALKVTHMIVSHHGEYEWQSPKRPKFLEAVLLHLADLTDAQVGHFGSLKGGGLVWDKTLDRYLYLENKSEE